MSNDFEEMKFESSGRDFELADGVWEGIRNQPHLKEELELKIAKEAQLRAEKLVAEQSAAVLEEVKKQAAEEGRKMGIAQGLEEAKQLIESLNHSLSEAAGEIRSQMESWTQSMEKEWSEAFIHLVQELAVPRGESRAAEITDWVRRHVDDSFEDQKIRIFLSEPELSRVQAGGIPVEGSGWEWLADPNLREGQVRCESRLGRLFLDPGEVLQRVSQILSDK